ncbi:MAG TPA: hypothetical protein ENG03_11155 [Thioploca sp.]|nr:MAG: hypothetical protein DRR19_15135 [Gammaproteobacteria bacterium]HDN27632.1 hypothetical protein [Thioploca sp.]
MAHISSALKKRKQRIDEQEKRYVFELAGDIDLLSMESTRVLVLGISFLLTLIIFWLLQLQQQGWLMDLAALPFGINIHLDGA